MPVFLQGRRAFLSSLRRRHRRCNPLSVHRVTDSSLAYPRRAYSCRAYPRRTCPVAAACHSYPHLASPAAAAFGYRSAARTATSPAWSEKPHDPCPFSHPAQGTATARIPFAVLPGAQKRRTEPHRGPSAAKKQPICRGSITAAALQPVRSVHAPETDPFRIVRAGISG